MKKIVKKLKSKNKAKKISKRRKKKKKLVIKNILTRLCFAGTVLYIKKKLQIR